jgi:hypothetical protein
MNLVSKFIEVLLRDRVCRVCVSRLADGSCGFCGGKCPLFDHLDDLIDIVDTTHDDLLDAYVNRVRELICASCTLGTAHRCSRRNRLECALDLYLSLAIEVIEEQLELGRSRPGGGRVRL